MEYDIIFVVGELYFDHPLCGTAILNRFLEKKGYSVGIIEMPVSNDDVKKLGKPNLFFAVSAGSIDSMVRNYTPLKKLRKDDKNLDYNETVPDRATILYCNWIKQYFKGVPIIIGGTEASLRRFTHYDYWDNKLRKSILLDSKADLLIYGSAEKQVLELAERLKVKKPIDDILGTCVVVKKLPAGTIELPSHEEVSDSKEKFCDMQMLLSNKKQLAQKTGDRYVLQHKSPGYTSKDLDEYYGLPFTRICPMHLRGFEFSVVTHRGCIGECSFCSLALSQGNRIISRSEKSILDEIERIAKMKHFKGNIDDLGGPSANMYGMDCAKCDKECLHCSTLDRSNARLLSLLKKARSIKGVKHVYIRSGIRYDLLTPECIKEIALHHIYDTLRVAPEHTEKEVLDLMNKRYGDIDKFIKEFEKTGTRKELSFYFMAAHPGASMKEAQEIAKTLRNLKNAESVQVFIPTPMTVSTCMYYTGLDPRTKKKIYVPYTYSEKKRQKRVMMGYDEDDDSSFN
ncbi:MAG: YgiQ family radical SAM protein [Candidatus Woesearchaeota archaeon]